MQWNIRVGAETFNRDEDHGLMMQLENMQRISSKGNARDIVFAPLFWIVYCNVLYLLTYKTK